MHYKESERRKKGEREGESVLRFAQVKKTKKRMKYNYTKRKSKMQDLFPPSPSITLFSSLSLSISHSSISHSSISHSSISHSSISHSSISHSSISRSSISHSLSLYLSLPPDGDIILFSHRE
jgi:hypothetical protein